MCFLLMVRFQGILAGRLFDLGYFKHTLVTACIAMAAANFLISECKEYWQFLLCQGIAVGVSIAVALISVTYLCRLLALVRCHLRADTRCRLTLVQAQKRHSPRIHGCRLEYWRHHLPYHRS